MQTDRDVDTKSNALDLWGSLFVFIMFPLNHTAFLKTSVSTCASLCAPPFLFTFLLSPPLSSLHTSHVPLWIKTLSGFHQLVPLPATILLVKKKKKKECQCLDVVHVWLSRLSSVSALFAHTAVYTYCYTHVKRLGNHYPPPSITALYRHHNTYWKEKDF